MPYKSEEYRAKAAECAELALKTKDHQSKRVLQLTAEQWRALADSADWGGGFIVSRHQRRGVRRVYGARGGIRDRRAQ